MLLFSKDIMIKAARRFLNRIFESDAIIHLFSISGKFWSKISPDYYIGFTEDYS